MKSQWKTTSIYDNLTEQQLHRKMPTIMMTLQEEDRSNLTGKGNYMTRYRFCQTNGRNPAQEIAAFRRNPALLFSQSPHFIIILWKKQQEIAAFWRILRLFLHSQIGRNFGPYVFNI